MNARIIKDKNIPATWKRVATDEHRYIVMQSRNTRNIYYEVYHSDDCTLNNNYFLFDGQGGIEKALLTINHYESQSELEAKDNDIINEFLSERQINLENKRL